VNYEANQRLLNAQDSKIKTRYIDHVHFNVKQKPGEAICYAVTQSCIAIDVTSTQV
jgi:hypothetical protein